MPGSFYFVEPRAEAGHVSGRVVARVRDLRERLRSFESLLAFRMVPFNVGEAARNERIYGQLVSGNYFSALGLTPAPAGSSARTRSSGRPATGRGGLARSAQARFGSAAAASARRFASTIATDDRRRRAGALSGHRARPGLLDVGPGDARAARCSRVARARFARGARLLRDGAARAPASTRHRRRRTSRAMRELARVYPESNGTMTGQVLSFWPAPRGPQGMITGALAGAAGHHAAGAARGLRQHGEPDARAREHAAARGRRPPGARRRPRAHRLGAARRERAARPRPAALLGVAIAVWGTNAMRAVPFIGRFPSAFRPTSTRWALPWPWRWRSPAA